ncbi:MAG: hypothetical protein IJ515_03745 [Clostridia bacterium]|nr:hypothetical protein [Clostridia bacterium]
MKNLISMRAVDDSIVKMECYDRLDSTVGLAREYAKAGYADRYAVISEYDGDHESDGRGIYMSVILRPSIFPSQAGLLSSLATVALLTALEEHTTDRLGIGWVSNIYCEGKYIGGVSIEGKLDNFTSYEYIIVSFAVRLSEKNFPPRIADLIKKVFESDNDSVTTIIAKTVLNKFLPFYSTMKTSNKFMKIYKQRFLLLGVRAKYIEDGRKRACRIVELDPASCELTIEFSDRTRRRISSPTSLIMPKSIKLPKNK